MKLFQKAKKSLGQNFLIDNNIIKKIIEIGNINKDKTIANSKFPCSFIYFFPFLLGGHSHMTQMDDILIIF